MKNMSELAKNLRISFLFTPLEFEEIENFLEEEILELTDYLQLEEKMDKRSNPDFAKGYNKAVKDLYEKIKEIYL